jgi:hypothetical protein
MKVVVALLPAHPLAFYSLITSAKGMDGRRHRPSPREDPALFDAFTGGLVDNPTLLD